MYFKLIFEAFAKLESKKRVDHTVQSYSYEASSSKLTHGCRIVVIGIHAWMIVSVVTVVRENVCHGM